MVDTHILVYGFGRKQGNMTSSKSAIPLENNSPGSKAALGEHLCVCKYILIRYDIVLVRYDTILDMGYIYIYIYTTLTCKRAHF